MKWYKLTYNLSVVIRNKKNQLNEWEFLLPTNWNRLQGISNGVSWPIELLCQCKSNENTRIRLNQKPTKAFFFFFFSPPLNVTTHTFSHWSVCLRLTLFCYIAGSTIKTKTFKIVLRFKELQLFTKNCSCRLDVIADLHQQCYHIWSDVNKELL